MTQPYFSCGRSTISDNQNKIRGSARNKELERSERRNTSRTAVENKGPCTSASPKVTPNTPNLLTLTVGQVRVDLFWPTALAT